MRLRRLRLPGNVTGLLLALQTTPVASQAPAERLALSAFRDSLASITDTAPLRDGQRTMGGPARLRPESGLARLRLGLVSLRLAELGAMPDVRDAVKTLRGAAEERPEWPYAWYALGLAEALRAAWEREDRLALGNRVGLPTLERAATRHRRALEADRSFSPAAVALAALTLELRDTALLASAQGALRRAAAAPNPPPDVFLAWGRIERAAEGTDSARVAFERYLAAG